mmetsp:Transcript_2125/g.5239  ORF Transcript_2125/g.5239 Transcript_2125/m.5239 type:complete len:207 (+) Transcript_2125:453-1073(+)
MASKHEEGRSWRRDALALQFCATAVDVVHPTFELHRHQPTDDPLGHKGDVRVDGGSCAEPRAPRRRLKELGDLQKLLRTDSRLRRHQRVAGGAGIDQDSLALLVAKDDVEHEKVAVRERRSAEHEVMKVVPFHVVQRTKPVRLLVPAGSVNKVEEAMCHLRRWRLGQRAGEPQEHVASEQAPIAVSPHLRALVRLDGFPDVLAQAA